jgi:hypothetical protein
MGCAAAGAAGGAAVSDIGCSWCGQPATRRYPARYGKGATTTAIDCYLCPDCDALVQAGKPLPAGVATFSVVVREEGS